MTEPRKWPSILLPDPPPADGTVLLERDGWRWVADSSVPGGVADGVKIPGGPAANEDTLRSRAETALTTLEQAVTNWDSLTANQKDGALKLTVRVVAGLVRLALRRFESAGS